MVTLLMYQHLKLLHSLDGLSNENINRKKMVPRLTYIVLFFAVSSCGVRTLEGRAKPVYFTTDPAVFKDTSYPLHPIFYRALADLKGAGVETAELREDVITKVLVKRPTRFFAGNSQFLVYPGEHIIVKGLNDSLAFFAANGNKQRNRELSFLKKFQELRQQQLQKYSSIPSFQPGVSLERILTIEEQQKDLIRKAGATYQFTFDSLTKAYNVSKKFKKLIDGYTKNNYDFSLNDFYRLHRDTLIAHGLYFPKLREAIPRLNNITKRSDFNANVREGLNDRLRDLFPGNLMWSFNDDGLKACFDSIENNFTGFARDYLLSRLMYRAYSKGTKVPSEYEIKYKAYSRDKTYRKIVKNMRKQHQRDNKESRDAPNELLAADGKLKVSLDGLLARHKGKYVYMDLWASWCGPCIKEMPHLQQIIDKYPNNKVTFITVSIDRQTFLWRDEIIKLNIQAWNNFLLIDAAKTSFSKQYNINAIPRYLLFNKEGKVINPEAPSPSDPALIDLLNKLALN